MKQIISIIGLLFSLSAISCTGEKKTEKIPPRPDMSAFKGKTTERVICRLDSNNSYSLYLPSAYDTSHQWPVIIAFDSHGDGRLPVNLMAEQAEKYRTIIIGSNNSKNGLPPEITSAIYDVLLKDAEWRFSLDKRRIYTMGFSGGARVAAYQALNKSGIRGVIGCSAGFPSNSIPPGANFQYLGIVGSDDFNLLEMKQLFKSLEGTNIPHYLVVFDGIHAWPPKETVPDIFNWMQLSNMKDGIIQKDETWIKGTAKDYEDRIGELIQDKSWIKALETSNMAKFFCQGFPQEQNFIDRGSNISKIKEVIQAVELQNSWLQKEQALQQQYLTDLQSKNSGWWTKEVSRLQELIKQKKGTEEAHVYKRVLSYMSLVCYMNAMQLIKTGPPDAFRYMVLLYALVDPENSETAYLQAVVDMRDQKAEQALVSLNKAIGLGFKDRKRLETDSSFINLRNGPGFAELLSKLN